MEARSVTESKNEGRTEVSVERIYKTREEVGRFRRVLLRNVTWTTLRAPLSLIITLLIWHGCTTHKVLIFSLVPTPLEVLREAIHFIPSAKYWQYTLATNARVIASFLTACVIAIPFGLAMGYKRVFNEYTFPIFEILRPCPPMAWLPLSAIALPTMEASVIFLGFLGAFFPVVMNTYLGVISLPVNYRHAALSLGASPNHIFRRIILPGATPSVFTGMAVGIGMTWEMVAAAEMIAASEGLGYMVWDAYWLLAYPRIILGMISLGVCGYVYSAAIRVLGNKVMPWKRPF
jgi:NitT/TauT family transport system permease protein